MKIKIVGKKVFEIEIPSSPEQMQSDDWLFIYEQKDLGLKLIELKVKFLLSKLSILPKKLIKSFSDEQIVEICDKLDFISESYTPHLCPLEILQIGKEIYKTSNDIFFKVKGVDYAYIESYYQRYQESDDIFELFKVMAILYAPVDIKFEEAKVIERAELFMSALSIYHAQLVSDWYTTLHQDLETEFEDVFKGNGKKSEVESLGFIEVIYSLAGEKLGPVEKVENQSIREILTAALLEMNSAKRIKEAMNSKT